MRTIKKIAALALALGMGLALLAGCGGGSGWLYGEGAPAAELGENGALYLDTASWDVYTKADGVWTAQGTIKGETGETGNGWLGGSGAPSPSLGRDGDFYVDTASWDVYLKEGGEWTFRDNLDGDSEYHRDFFKTMTLTGGALRVLNAVPLTAAQRYFAASVQGLFAQIGESKYYLNYGGVYETWLGEIEGKYGKETADTSLDDVCADYLNRFSKGYVLYNAASRESINCARTVAGARQLAMVDVSLTEWAAANGLEMRIDATHMTAEECFDTYHDELDSSAVMQEAASAQCTDYAIACRYYSYYPEGDQGTNGAWDHPLPPQDDFEPLREKVLTWCRGGLVFGDFPLGEYGTVKLNALYDHPTVVGSGMANMTVTACVGYFGKECFVQPYKPTDKALRAEDYPLDKHYVTIVNGDGDNVGCWFGGTFESPKYMGAARGDFPIGWEVNPSLAAMAPAILDHTYANADETDTFVCSISGFGHTFLRYFSDRALARLASQLDRYLKICDFSVVKILDDGSIRDEDRVIEAFSRMEHAEGFFYCTYFGAYEEDHGAVRWTKNGKPVVSCRYTLWENFGDSAGIAAKINASSTDATKIDAYSYVNLHVWSRDYEDVREMVSLLDDTDVVVVDPITFLRLIEKNVPHTDAAPAA